MLSPVCVPLEVRVGGKVGVCVSVGVMRLVGVSVEVSVEDPVVDCDCVWVGVPEYVRRVGVIVCVILRLAVELLVAVKLGLPVVV